MTVARAVLFGDATLTPLAGPQVGVIATAKRDLRQGERIDGIGGFMTYGQAENSDVIARERLLPMGLAEGAVLRRAVGKAQALHFNDVDVPQSARVTELYAEMEREFGLIPEPEGAFS